MLSTLHTNDSPSAITRLLDIGVPHYLIQAALIGVVARRLVRTLCPHCKAEDDIDSNLWRPLVTPPGGSTRRPEPSAPRLPRVP